MKGLFGRNRYRGTRDGLMQRHGSEPLFQRQQAGIQVFETAYTFSLEYKKRDASGAEGCVRHTGRDSVQDHLFSRAEI